jgi:phosphate transport system ATP-binding protein
MVKTDFSPEWKICLEDLEAGFGSKTILKKLNTCFLRKKITTIIGSSGSGKTTLLRALNRLNDMEESYFTAGKVFIHLEKKWHDILGNSFPSVSLRRKIGMVFQHPNPLPTSIERNIKLPLKVVTGMTRPEREERMVHALRQVHLWDEVKDRLKKPALILSGGQQQRLCLARTLALEPEIILLDEPTSSLDFKASRRIEELLVELKEKYTLIVVSHSLRQTRRISDKVCILNSGEIIREFDNTQIQDDQFFYRAAEEFF